MTCGDGSSQWLLFICRATLSNRAYSGPRPLGFTGMEREIVPCEPQCAQVKGVHSPSLGTRCRERALPLWSALPGSIGWGCCVSTPRALQMLRSDLRSYYPRSYNLGCSMRSPGRLHAPQPRLSLPCCQQPHSITGFDLMSVRIGQVLATIKNLWYWYGLCLVAKIFNVISFRLRMVLPSGFQSSQCCL